MKNSIKLAALAGAVTLFSACADDVTNVYNENSGMSVLEKGKKLSKQACDSSSVGEMLYVTDSAAAYFCNGKKWEPLKGEDGEDGKDGNTCSVKQSKDKSVTTITCETKDGKVSYDVKNGADGEDGKNGKDGVDGKNGKNGKDGADGDDCKVEDDGDGNVTIVCGEGDGLTSATLYKGFCGTQVYDPMTQICDNRDNQIYNTVTIGKQTWMAENLNYDVKKTENGTVKDFSICAGQGVGTVVDCERYGRLYTWAAAMDSIGEFSDMTAGCGSEAECNVPHSKSGPLPVRGVCPAGWHIPAEYEWNVLIDEVGGEDVAGKMLKTVDQWTTPPAPGYTLLKGTDEYGFSALPAGTGVPNSSGNGGVYTDFWSSTITGDADNKYAYTLFLSHESDAAVMNENLRSMGFSIRCLKDN